MRKIVQVLLMSMLLGGCGAPEQEQVTTLTTRTEANVVAIPAYADVVIEVVADTGCEIRGYLTWFNRKVPYPGGGFYGGMSGFDASGNPVLDVYTFADGRDATRTTLAHEWGHICLRTDDDNKAEAFANLINAEARVRVGQPAWP